MSSQDIPTTETGRFPLEAPPIPYTSDDDDDNGEEQTKKPTEIEGEKCISSSPPPKSFILMNSFFAVAPPILAGLVLLGCVSGAFSLYALSHLRYVKLQ